LERFIKGDIVILPFPFTNLIVFRKIGQITHERLNNVIDAIIFILKQ